MALNFWNEYLWLQSAQNNIGHVPVHLRVVCCRRKLVKLLQLIDNKISDQRFQTQSLSGLKIETCDLKQIAIQLGLFTCIDIARMTVLHPYVKNNAETSRVSGNHCETWILEPPHVFDYYECCFVLFNYVQFLTFFLIFSFMMKFVYLFVFMISSDETCMMLNKANHM